MKAGRLESLEDILSDLLSNFPAIDFLTQINTA